ncbi:DUF3047 domain-containing protein [Cupriavidus sp. 30B13]|uniref:DUF3047 domain-containing protein n=1 Tax=Cupriavidus sp. 30B13 TaxID=3384241 RepID=UPI003CF81303
MTMLRASRWLSRTRRLAGLLACGLPLWAAAQGAPPGVAFSTDTPGGALPAGWKNLPVAHGKMSTRYSLVADGSTTVLEADADASASALMHDGDIDLAATPQASWRWKIEQPIENADNRVAAQEDAPARLVFLFDGDKEKLSLGERAAMQLAHTLAGEDLPYATLMYIWSDSAPVGTIIDNPHTSRVKMIVASGGPGDVGKWLSLSRNVAQDYERAFKEAPGRLTAYGLLTDTDNTGAVARAWYGDIRFSAGK